MTSSQFLYYCKQGRINKVKEGLKDPEVDPTTINNTPFLAAVYNNNIEIVKLLLKDDRINPRDNNDKALYYAATNGDIEIVKILLDLGLDPNINDEFRSSAVIASIAYDYPEITKLLLKSGVVNLSAYFSYIVLESVKHNYVELLKYILDNYMYLIENKEYLIDQAIISQSHNVLRLFINEFNIDLSINNNEFLVTAINHMNIVAIQYLLNDEKVLNNIFKLRKQHFAIIHNELVDKFNMTKEELIELYDAM